MEQTIDEIDHVTDKSIKKTSVAEVGFLDKMKRLYSQMTTETEGWIASFVEDSE